MKIYYVLESVDLCGGVKVVFDQARALSALGHDVIIRTIHGDHAWYPYPVDIRYADSFHAPLEVLPDVVIGTYWTTISPILNMNVPVTCHLCQGYEGSFPELKPFLADIEAVYKIPLPKLTVGEWLSTHLTNIFGATAFPIYTIGQIVDTDLFQPLKNRHKDMFPNHPNILIVGDYAASCKGIDHALNALAILRKRGVTLRLTRVSLNSLCDREKAITPVDQSLVKISPQRMAQVYHDADIMVAPNLSNEGFGLPLAEAMASGVPSVATSIPSFLSFDHQHDYAYFVPQKDPEAIADGINTLLHDTSLRSRLSDRGPMLITTECSAKTVARRIQSVLKEVSHGF